MKTLGLLILSLLTIAALNGRAQGLMVTNAGWFPIGYYDVLTTNDPTANDGAAAFAQNIQPQTPPNPPVVAEAITTDIQALADGLQDDPLKIYNYVHDHIRYILYFGSKKGANLTLLEKSGNDFDQCALLVALLRAAGYGNAGYQFGWMPLPFDNPDGSNRDLHHWLGLNFTNTPGTWPSTYAYLNELFKFWRGYPANSVDLGNLGNNTFAFQRVWVTVTVGGTNYNLDPAFKVSAPVAGVSLATAMGSSPSAISSNLLSVAGGLDFGTINGNCYATNLNETAISNALCGYTVNLLNYLQSNAPNASVEQILGGESIIPSTNTLLSQDFPFAATNLNGTMPPLTWVNIPTNLMSTLQITFGGKNYQWLIPQLQGQRLSLVYGASTVQLWQDDTNLASGTFNTTDAVTLTAHHPYAGSWDTTNNLYIPNGGYTATHTATYYANSDYAILYSFEPDWGWLRERENKLDAYRHQGQPDTSRQVVTETLNIMGLNWELQTEYMSRMLAQQIGVLPMNLQKIGRMAQESGRGYYVDIYLATEASANNVGQACDFTCDIYHGKWFDLYGYFSSAMEHGMIEQLQTSGIIAGSTVKMLEMANANHEAIYLASSANWSTVQTKLSNYTINDLAGYINAGYMLLLPQDGSVAINGSGSWTGFGLMARLPNEAGTLMIIGPGIFGGYASDLGATVNPAFIDYASCSQPLYFDSAPASVANLTAADPVNTADGTFQVQTADLSLGQTEPRGLAFSRYYNSSRRNSNLAGMGPGWLHNYYMNAAMVSAPQAGLGGTTPAQAAAMLAATSAANAVYTNTPDPKNWMVTALIAKWGIDQLTAKAVSVSMGQDTLQFIKQPNGSYTPPANTTQTLTQNGSAYSLQERHGRTFNFNGTGWATNIVDPYQQALTLTYNSSNLVQTVTDWKGRTLTFKYNSGSSNRLLAVTDNGTPARTVTYGYSAAGDLTAAIDPQGGTNSYLYDTNHQITATVNALGQLVASNLYNSFGRVTTQYTGGSLNKMWRIFWSGWRTVSQDPAGGQQTYFYDDQTRLVGQQDALGDLTQTFYDGQDHVVMTVSPLNETNQFIYDGNNNLLAVIDPLGFTNQFAYDGQNNLIQAVDANGHPTTYGYNAQFSLTGQTNGAGDWVNYVYNTTGSPGTLASRTDSGGTTSYGYDSYGQLNLITYPGSLGGESFGNSSLGDVTNHTDARGFATSYQYNARRQLTNSVAASNVVNRLTYDAVGNNLTATDARGNSLTNTWSATRHLLATALPTTAPGASLVTNIYDARDWLVQTLDAYQQPTGLTNDLAGRPMAVTDPLKRTTTFSHDADGHKLAAVNAANETNRQTWDARGSLIQAVDGAGHTSTRTYDAAGNQITLTNRNGNAWQFQFDAANRLTNTISPLLRKTSVVFNHQGLPAQLTDPASRPTAFYYDGKGRLTNRTDNLATTLYGYDANDNPTNVVENGNTNAWTFDAYNHVSSYRDASGNLIQYRYDANGNMTNLIYPGSLTVTYNYDNLNHLTNVTDWTGRKTKLAYDLDGRLTRQTRPNGTYRTIGYDAAGQVTNIWEQMANGLPIAWFRLNWTNSGTLAWEFAAPLPHAVTVPTRTMTYDADNRLQTFNGLTVGGDLDGNLTNAPLITTNFATYSYDARNRLLNAGGVTNIYDALNNRIGQTAGTNTTAYVVNPNAALPQVLMRIKNGVTNYYVYGAGLMYQITQTGTNTSTLTYHYDYRGSTIALSGDNGLVTDRMEYSLYALTTYRAGTNDTPFWFNGQYGVQTDPNGLLYMRSRYYNPYLCRFINADPSGFGGGLNQYAFANGNPASYLDPYGLGALGESALTSSWFNAPTPAETEAQTILAGFVNLATLGVANLASSLTTGNDLAGNHLDVGDAFTQTLQEGVFVGSLALSVPTDGASVEAGAELEGEAGAAETTAARTASGDFYSVAYQTTLDPASYPGISRAAHFQEANEALLTAMESDPQLAQTMQQAGVNLDRTATGLAPRTPPEGWTWHHAEDPGVMQLVPRAQHTPGSIFWDTLHPGGQGGYAIWGKQ